MSLTPGVLVIPDDLARVVDVECRGVVGRQGIVEGGEGKDCHDTGPSLIAVLMEASIREAEPPEGSAQHRQAPV